MSILVTGASGYVGVRLVPKLSAKHEVIALSRKETTDAQVTIRGDFTSRDDLQALDEHQIDTVVHLASEIGGCSEEAGLGVNVLGTQMLMRYLIERGCKHFVVASSIAAVGCLDKEFLPRELPIGDDHPCEAKDAYGLSKALMEELAFYLQRKDRELDITVLRLGLVLADDAPSDGRNEVLTRTPWPFCAGGGVIAVGDVLDAFVTAVEQPPGPGVRRHNLVAATSRTTVAVPEALRSVFGERAASLDMTYYAAEEREMASLYSIDGLWQTFGFRPSIDVRTTPRLGVEAS